MGVEFIKCTNCKGSGYIRQGHNTRGVMKCPVCKGRGVKPVLKSQNKEKK